MGNGAAISENARRNKPAVGCYLVTVTVITVAYLIEALKHSKSWGYFLITFLLFWIPGVLVIVTLKRKPDSKLIRYMILLGYVTPWAFLLFTATNNLVFTYALVLMILLNAYADRKFAIESAVLFNVVNVAAILFQIITKGFDKDSLPTIEIQVLLMLLCGIYNVFTAKTGGAINDSKMQEIEDEKNRVSGLLSTIMSVSNEISGGIEQMTGRMGLLDEAMNRTCVAMEEVRSGSTETAESVQTQLIMTEEIQNRIDEVSHHATAIVNSVLETRDAVAQGSDNMNNLEQEVEASKLHSDSAAKELEQLEGYTQQMQTIVELINNVADQTSLLALNASIEAARAGEAGRGFSVVATEISNLANQTQAATDDIQELIANINHKFDDVAKAINTFIEGSAKQHDVAMETVKSLGTIQTDTSSIEHNAEGLTTAVQRLSDANRKIVESIQSISAITEEVSAHSNETYESSRNNTDTVNEMMGIVEHLNQQAALLHQN